MVNLLVYITLMHFHVCTHLGLSLLVPFQLEKETVQNETILQRSVNDLNDGKVSIAIESLENLRSQSPLLEWQKVLAQLGRAYAVTKDEEKYSGVLAEIQMRKNNESSPAERWAADKATVYCMQWKGDLAAALKVLEQALVDYPGSREEILARTVDAAERALAHAGVQRYGTDFMSSFPKSEKFRKVAFQVVEAHRLQNHFEEAIAICEKLIASRPDCKTHGKVVKAEILGEHLKKIDEANELLRTVIAANEEAYEVYLAEYQLGWNLLERKHDASEARKVFEKALPKYPKDNLAIEIAGYIAETYNLEGQHVKAAELYEKAMKSYPCPVPEWKGYLWYMAGHSYLRSGNREDWARCLRSAINDVPETAWAKLSADELLKEGAK